MPNSVFGLVVRLDPALNVTQAHTWTAAFIAANPGCIEALYEHGRKLYKQDNYAAAAPFFERAFALKPTDNSRGIPRTQLKHFVTEYCNKSYNRLDYSNKRFPVKK